MKALPGHYYAVGMGPGASDLLTLRAAHIIETADVLFAPKSEKSAKSLALDLAASFIHDHKVEIVEYPMTRDPVLVHARWTEIAKQVANYCCNGSSVVQLTIGDPLIYSTSCYLLEALQSMLPSEYIHIIPGITAFQATAALVGEPLVLQEDRMLLMPATDMKMVEHALAECETLVLYKIADNLHELKELLARHGLLNNSVLVQYAEQETRQTLLNTFNDVTEKVNGYMATVIVHVSRRHWR